MSRNDNRSGAQPSPDPTAALEAAEPTDHKRSPLEFVTPTDYVELPSKGKGYPPDHPLCNKETVEIKYMTAKEEDILTSRTLVKKGLALEKFLESIILDKTIKTSSLLTGDRNAIIIAARMSGFGEIYETLATCPSCGEKSQQNFDLKSPKVWHGKIPDIGDVQATEKGTYLVTVPVSKFRVELRLMTGQNEANVMKATTDAKKRGFAEVNMTEQYKQMIASVEGHSERRVINHFIANAPARDTRFLKTIYMSINPDVKIVKDFVCPHCNHEQELEVSFGTDFFWPDR
tara:strand:- start:229 stop:1092 length:864 start_codon:yes stop_codon:yes gene_type:complete